MKIIKKTLKICSYIVVFIGFLLLVAEFSLRYILPLDSIKTKALSYVSQKIGAEVKAGDISAGLFSIEIDNVSVDITKDVPQNLLTCNKMHLVLNPFKLLFAQLSIKKILLEKPYIQIIRYQDGSFNFDSLISSDEEQEVSSAENVSESGEPFDFRIKNLQINKAKIFYTDLKEDIKANIQDFDLYLNRFSFYNPFSLEVNFTPYFEQKGLILDNLKFALCANTDLKKLNLQEAVLDLKTFLVSYKDTLFSLKAKVNNFENPSIDFNSELKNLSNETLKPFADTPAFKIPLFTAKGNLDYLANDSKTNINNLILQIADTKLSAQGKLDFKKDFIANGKIELVSILDSLKDILPLIEEYNPLGKLKANFDFNIPLQLKGNLTLEDAGVFVKNVGTFDNINGTAEVKTIDEITIDSLSGNLNKNPFNIQASYSNKKDFMDVLLNFKTDKLFIAGSSNNNENAEQQVPTQEENQPESETEDDSSFTPMNINATVDIKKLDIPYLKGNNLIFKAKAKNITPLLNKTHGTLSLGINNGQIKDVYTLADANALTKVMFMSLGIVSKVINTLNVLDLLNGMGKVLSGKKETEEDIPQHQEINGKMDFDSFETAVDFNQGLATMKKCSFVSDMFSFRVNGNINFDNRKIKLNVDSAPGKHKEDGIMPLNIDIKGTIEEPKGSLSVLSSVSALVGDTVMNNPVSNMLKNTWSKLFSSSKEENTETEE